MKLTLALVSVLLGTGSVCHATDMACLYSDANYQGAKFCFQPGQQPPDLDAFPLNDGTYTNGYFGSIEVKGNVVITIYDSTNYQSSIQPMYFTSSVPNLAASWNSTIFSLDVEYR